LSALVAVLVGVVAGWLCWRGSNSPALPKISNAQLDPTSARVIEKYLDSVRHAPRSGAAWGELGGVLRLFEFREEAGRCFAIAERLNPKEVRWPYLHGLLLATDSPASAIACLRRAVALCGNEPDTPRLRLARLLAEDGQGDKARRELEPLVQARPDHAPALLALAQLAEAAGHSTQAVSLASRCTKDSRTARAAWTLLSVLHQRLGDTNASRNASQTGDSLPPDAPVADVFELETIARRGDPRVLSDRAQWLLQSGRLTEAAPIVTQLVQDQPQFAEGWLLLGRWQLLRQEPAAAEQSIRRHLELEPQSVNGLFQLGMALLAQGQSTNASAAFEQATRLKPDFGPAFFNLGLALLRSGRKHEALTPLHQAIRHNPERIDPYILLAELHLQLGERSEAARLFGLAKALNPADRRLPALGEKIARVSGE